MRAIRLVFVFLCATVISNAFGSNGPDEQPALEFQVGSEPTSTVSLSEMRDKLSVHTVELLDPHYGKQKRYRGFLLSDFLNHALGDSRNKTESGLIVFDAADGYQVSMQAELAFNSQSFIVIADLAAKGWESIPGYGVTPEPFYLVWTNEGQVPQNGFPWPWKISAIRWAEPGVVYENVIPRGLAITSSAYAGYELFRTRCIGCHAIRGDGGKVGPDLGGILTYRSESVMREFIRSPSSFRPSKMPGFKDISDHELDRLIDYFRRLDQQQVSSDD